MAIDRNSGTGIAQYGIEHEGKSALQPLAYMQEPQRIKPGGRLPPATARPQNR
jgi:hypothetical protein